MDLHRKWVAGLGLFLAFLAIAIKRRDISIDKNLQVHRAKGPKLIFQGNSLFHGSSIIIKRGNLQTGLVLTK